MSQPNPAPPDFPSPSNGSRPLWRIDALKFDQHLHYTLNGTLIDDNGTRLWLRTEAGTTLQHFTRGFVRPMRYRSDMHFWRDRWYNVFLNYTPGDETTLAYAYCNVGLPPTINGNSLSFVDLDLDVCFWPDGRYEVLDEDEFIDHARRYAYPPATQDTARRTVDEIIALWHAAAPPFDRLR